jgi:hypothetical protein
MLSLTGFSMSQSIQVEKKLTQKITKNNSKPIGGIGEESPIDPSSNEDDTEDSEEESFDEKDAFEDYILTLHEPLFIYTDSSETNSLFRIYNTLSSPNLDVPYSPPELIAFLKK